MSETFDRWHREYKQRSKWLESLAVDSKVYVQGRFPQQAQVVRVTSKQLIVPIKYGVSDMKLRFWRKTGDQVGGGMRIWPIEPNK